LVPATFPASVPAAVLRQPHKQVVFAQILVRQQCAIALVAEILTEFSQRFAF
jgi:hypothetical protein